MLTSFLDMRLGMIVILDEDGEPEIVASAGWASEGKGKPIQTLPRGVIDRLVATSTPLAVEDVAKDPLFAACADVIASRLGGKVSFLGVPVKSDDRVIGTLSIVRVWDEENAGGFDDDFSFLKMVANLVGQTVRLHRMLSAERKRFLDERRTLEKALDNQLAETRAPAPKIGGIVGESAAIRKVMERIGVVAKSNTTVLLRGESGTGKELFARAIHDLSPRKSKAFVKLNCAALPESVLESELFGHEKGAFTGAVGQRAGRFELAHGGTLLLDEIGEISANFQAKLLRVLQEGEFERVGGTRTLKVDVRLICATNKNLEQAVAKGEFRADLYYRINVIPIFLPPLRDRPDDIALLARAFIDRFNAENGRKLAIASSAHGNTHELRFSRQRARARELRSKSGDADPWRGHPARGFVLRGRRMPVVAIVDGRRAQRLFGPNRRARERPHHRRAGLRKATTARSSAAVGACRAPR